jgi:hypothetical protein
MFIPVSSGGTVTKIPHSLVDIVKLPSLEIFSRQSGNNVRTSYEKAIIINILSNISKGVRQPQAF